MTNIDPQQSGQGPSQENLAAQVKAAADAEWGWVRRTLSAHPLTGAWAFFLIGLGLGFILEYQSFLVNGH